jgi:ABC-type sugar transport system ATPase subunit
LHEANLVLRLSDQVVVMRAGQTVARRRTSDTDGQELVALVTGAIQDPIAVHEASVHPTDAHADNPASEEDQR